MDLRDNEADRQRFEAFLHNNFNLLILAHQNYIFSYTGNVYTQILCILCVQVLN